MSIEGSTYHQDQKVPLPTAEQYLVGISHPDHPFSDVVNRVTRCASFTAPTEVHQLFNNNPASYLPFLAYGLAEVNLRTAAVLKPILGSPRELPPPERYRDVIAANGYVIPPSHTAAIVLGISDWETLAHVPQPFMETAWILSAACTRLPVGKFGFLQKFSDFYALLPDIQTYANGDVVKHDELFAVIAPAVDRILHYNPSNHLERHAAKEILEINRTVLGDEEVTWFLNRHPHLNAISDASPAPKQHTPWRERLSNRFQKILFPQHQRHPVA